LLAPARSWRPESPVLADEHMEPLALNGRRIGPQPFEMTQLARNGNWDYRHDKGYAKGVVRRYLRRLGIRITIARRTNEHRGGPFDREIYRTRNLIERLINRLKHFRRVATRYEKCAENYRAMLTLAAIKIWL
jgi:hypothetical protein